MKKQQQTETLASMYMKIIQVPWYRPARRHRLVQEYNEAAKSYRIRRERVEDYIAEKYPAAYEEIKNLKSKE